MTIQLPARALAALLLIALAGCGLIIGIPDSDLLEPGSDSGEASAAGDATSTDGSSMPSVNDAAIDSNSLDAGPACDGADFAQDPANCGRCGHDCVGGTCASGVCQPVSLTVSAGAPILLVLDSTAMYWTESAGGVQSAPKTGGNALNLAATSGSVDRIAVDSAYVYYALIGSAVDYARLDAAAGSGVSAGFQQVSSLSVFNGVLYVSIAESGSASAVFACTSLPVPSCPGVIQALDNNAGSYIRDLKIDDAGFVFSASENVGGAVWTCPLSGCSGGGAQQIAANAGNRLELAITASTVFWIDADGGAGRIYRCDRGNCMLSQKVIAPNEGDPQGIAADATHVYWTDTARGRVLACPIAGCPDAGPTVLVEGGAPSAIALDSTAVYFANAVNAGTIARVAKP